MKRAIAWFAQNKVAANLLMFAIVVGGFASLPSIPLKTFPDVDVDVITVSVEYRGAAPEESEEGVCIRIEEEIAGIEGIDQIHSTAVEGACTVSAELLDGADMRVVLDDVKSAVDAITTFPAETEKPVIAQSTIQRAVADVAIFGAVDERTLKSIAEQVRDEILEIEGITQAEISLVRPFEISIEVSEESLRRWGLTFDEVARAVKQSSLDLPGGSIETEAGEILLRTKGQAYRGVEFEKIVVRVRADGTRITVGDVATVIDGFEDADLVSRFDGMPAALVHVYRVGTQDVLQIARDVHEYVDHAYAWLPHGLQMTVWQDDSRALRGRLDTLLDNARNGFLLILVLLALFLRPRLALWVTIGIPISILGTLGVFTILDLSIDVISLFAFILVLGILVDDAIVIGENVYTHQQRIGDRMRGAIEGATEVSVPVIFGVLTTMAAFAPLHMVGGTMSQVFGVMAAVVTACLFFSLVESHFVLPAHLGHGRDRPAHERTSALGRRWQHVQEYFGTSLSRFADGPYRRLLERALGWRYTTIAAATASLLLCVGVLASGHLRFTFFPPIEADYLAARITMPAGAPIEATEAVVRRLEDSVADLRARLDPEYAPRGESLVEHVLAVVGSQPYKERQHRSPSGSGDRPLGGAHLGEVILQLVPSEERAIATSEIARHWREIVGQVPDAIELVFASDLFSAGGAIEIQLQAHDIGELRGAAARLKERLGTYAGVVDISDSFREGKEEIELAIRPSAEPLGLTLSDLARQVRQAFYGEEVQRIQRGRDDIRVMVRYPEHQRRSLADMEQMRIRTPDGAEVAFSTVAHAELGRGYSTIRRSDRKRVVDVTADVDRSSVTPNEVLQPLVEHDLPEILADFPSVTYRLEGEQREQGRAFGGLARGFALALFSIFALLAVPLRSYAQALTIMSVIPFGVVGAVAGHLFMGRHLSFLSVLGIVALTGVVVNDSLVLVHTVNRLRASGLSIAEAVRQAGVSRFRPIVLTSLTTFAGLSPLLLERSMQAQFLIPMAISLAFGVLFATVVTLFVVPSLYLVLADVGNLWKRRHPPGERTRPRVVSFPPRSAGKETA